VDLEPPERPPVDGDDGVERRRRQRHRRPDHLAVALVGVMLAEVSTLAAGPVVFGALLAAAAFAVRRATPRKAQ
jgi:hypothetical protein